MKTALVLVLALLTVNTQAASDICASCGQALSGRVYFFTTPYSKERQVTCAECAQAKAHCEICQLPLRTNYTALKDGRIICKADYPTAVFSQDEARRLFDDLQRTMFRMFEGAGVAPERNIRVYLVDRPELDNLARTQSLPQDRTVTLGLTRTKHLKPGESEHEIYILSGLRRSRLQAVSAHEYTHAWLNQNLDEKRRLQVDTVEGFCDLAAHNAMSELGDTFETQIIQNNPYSKGQIKAMLQTQQTHRFYTVLKWMKSGTDDALDPANPNRVLALNETAPQWGWLPQAQTAAPERLILKGITGTPSRRLALVNNQTLATGETGKVRVGTTTVALRCLQVSEKSVLVEISETKETIELFLENNREAIPLGPKP